MYSCFVIISVLALCASARNDVIADEWRVGVASVKITPINNVCMTGHTDPPSSAKGKLTDLWAKALVLQDAESNTAVLITIDILGIDRATSQEVSRRILQTNHLPHTAIVFCVSHTHTGPIVGSVLQPTYDLTDQQQHQVDEYTKFLIDNLISVVGEAMQHLEPVKVYVGHGLCTVAVNRRNNPESQVSERRAQGRLLGPVDHDVPILSIRTLSGDLKAVIFGYACHGTVLTGDYWSGDWPGYAECEIECRHPGAAALL